MKTIQIDDKYYNSAEAIVKMVNSSHKTLCSEFRTDVKTFIENAITEYVKLYFNILETYRKDEINRHEEIQTIN